MTSTWSELPAPIINAIYQNLSDADKIAMSMVCKTWSEGFNDPSLWRARVFKFDGGIEKDDNLLMNWLNRKPPAVNSGKLAVRFARRFSRHMKNLEIDVFQPFEPSTESVSDLRTFSELFDAAVLKKIHLNFINRASFNDTQEPHAEFLKAFIRLLENQNSLEEFCIRDFSFKLRQGVQLVKFLAQACGEKLQTLALEKILSLNLETVRRTGPMITELKKFSNLMEVRLGSYFLNDELLHVWSRKCPKLKILDIFVCHENYVVTPGAWQAIINTHPELEVEIVANGEMISSLCILCPVLPLRSLVWDEGLCFNSEQEFTSFLNCMAQYQNTLERLYVKFVANYGDPDHAAVMNVLSKFSKIPQLTLTRCSYKPGFWEIMDENEYEM